MSVGYDYLSLNRRTLLDLPFEEGSGIITRDVAKPHHQDIALVNTPTWATLASGLGVLQLNGTTQYLELVAAACADLDFTSGDYSIGGWVNWQSGDISQIVIGRYVLDNNGWELYLTEWGGVFSLTLRHHHAAGAVVRSGSNSVGWAQGICQFMGISRIGGFPLHYRNALPVEATYDPVTGMIDPETCNQDLTIGIRYTKDADHFKNMLWRLRAWPFALTRSNWMTIFHMERHWFP